MIMADLEKAIDLQREALKICPHNHRNRSKYLNSFAVALATRYEQREEIADLNEAISIGREALDLRPRGHPERSKSLNNFACDLYTRSRVPGEMAELDKAIAFAREALELCPRGFPDRSICLGNLAKCLCMRYEQLEEMADLDQAIDCGREALGLQPGHTDRLRSLTHVIRYLSLRYQQLYHVTDLDDAIILGREALNLLPEGHIDRSSSLTKVAEHLFLRYQRLYKARDLDDAIVLEREALYLRPQDHPDRFTSLNDVAHYTRVRFSEFRRSEDLNEVIFLRKEALDLCPQGHPNRATQLNDVAESLFIRHVTSSAVTDINEAIVHVRETLDLYPRGHPSRPTSLNNLASYLVCRSPEGAIDEAIALGREVLQFCPSGHPDFSWYFREVMNTVHDKFKDSMQLKDIFNLYAKLAHLPRVVPQDNIRAAKGWVYAAQFHKHSTTNLAYETSLRLLVHRFFTLNLSSEHFYVPKDVMSLAMDTFSAFLRSDHCEKAVELLEQALCVLRWNPITRIRSPLDDLIASGSNGKSLANEFIRLSSLLHNAIDTLGPGQPDRLHHLNLEMEQMVASIRIVPGAERFLLPSLFSDLKHAASGGPVIIVSPGTYQYHSDAVFIFADRNPVYIPLYIMEYRVQDLSSQFRLLIPRTTQTGFSEDLILLLQTLWNEVVQLIVIVLRMADVPPQSRIWLCPIAEFAVLPLHAAGPYQDGEENLSDIYITSYTPSLTALIHARRHCSYSVTGAKRFVAVGPSDPIQEQGSAGSELDIVGQRIQDHAMFTRIEGSGSCISQVSQELAKNEWVHLACGGHSDLNRSYNSGFCLYDEYLTIQDIVKQCDLENAEFAYLSACHISVEYEGSPDNDGEEAEYEGEEEGEGEGKGEGKEKEGDDEDDKLIYEDEGEGKCDGDYETEGEDEGEGKYYDGQDEDNSAEDKNENEDKDERRGFIHLASAMQLAGFRSIISTMWPVDKVVTNKVASMFYQNMVDESGNLDHTRAAFALHKTMDTLVDSPFDQRISYVHMGA